MTNEPETQPRPRRAAALALAALTVALCLGVARWHLEAFPELSPRFSLKKGDVPGAAAAWATRFGLPTAGYRHAVDWDIDDEAKNFLELNHGVSQVAGEAARGVSLWHWTTRFFRPGQLEEHTVSLDTEGALVGFRQVIPETEQRPRPAREESLALAEAFLAANVPRHPVTGLKLTETEEEENPGHTVVKFTWERAGWTWGDGTYHLHASVAGNRVIRYSEHLEVPDAWARDFRSRRAANEVFQGVAYALLSLLTIASLVVAVGLARGRRFRARGFPRGWVLPAAAVILASLASSAPQVLWSYSTQDSFPGHVARSVVEALFGACVMSLGWWLLGVLGDGFLREGFPGRVSLRAILGGHGLATREALDAVALAFPLAALMLAWQTAYYVAGRHAGFWCPSSFDSAKVFTSLFPAVESLFIGVSAAWQEEILFRGVLLVAVWKLTRSKWAAIAIPALCWGFLHSNYPQLPGYARGVELTIEGLALGWVAMRYGILTTLIAHCLFNTSWGAAIAWKTGSPGQMALAVAVMLWPAALWATGRVAVWRRGWYTDAADPEDPPPPPHRPAPVIDTRAPQLSRGTAAAAALLCGSLAVAQALLPERPLEDLGKVRISRAEAGRRADAALREQAGLDPRRFHRSLWRVVDADAGDDDYLLRHVDAERLAELTRRYLVVDKWEARYFRDGEVETWTVHLSPSGELRHLSRGIAETAPGAQLGREDAIRTAEGHLRRLRGLAAGDYRFLDLSMTRQKERLDYSVTFESTRWEVGESRLRWTVTLVGDELEGIWIDVKLPEAYERERDASGWQDVVRQFVSGSVYLVVTAAMVGLFGFLVSRRLVAWRACLLLGLVPLALKTLGMVVDAPEFLFGYDTAQSLSSFVTRKAISMVSGLSGVYLSAVTLLAATTGVIRWVAGRPAAGVLLGGSAAEARRRFARGAVLAALGLGLLGWCDLAAYTTGFAFSGKALLGWDTPGVLGLSPGAGALLSALGTAIEEGLQTGVGALLIVVLWKRHRLLGAALATVALMPGWPARWLGLETAHELLFETAGNAIELWLFVRVFRFNPFPCLLLPYYRALLPQAALMTASAWPALRGDILLLWAAVAVPLVAAAAFALTGREAGPRREERRETTETPPPVQPPDSPPVLRA